MSTNPIGKNTKTIGVNMKREMAEEIERRATSLEMSTGAYIKMIVNRHLEEGEKIVLREQ